MTRPEKVGAVCHFLAVALPISFLAWALIQ